jgi:ERCC4-type nuclease
MRIVIDKRETEIFNKTNESLLRIPEESIRNIDIISEDLPIGDILIQSNDKTTILVIERKSFSDLLASIKDGRYEEQSHRLLHTTGVPPHSIIYLLEGMFSTIHQPAQKKLIYSAMTSLSYFKGFSIMRTSSTHETGEWLVALTEKLYRDLERKKSPYYASVPYLNSFRRNALPENIITPSDQSTDLDVVEKEPTILGPVETNYCNFVKKVKKENVTPENIGEIVLSQIPGISSVTAIAIMKKFSTFPKLMKALQENPNCLDDITTESNGKTRKISKSCIENIKKYFI